ncbi:MAG: hypothetical protein KA028_02775 [Candidatus Pacebacteria bacterium]|nr:hypothetical protein [Candidatus Paceibacterota bacterium]
MHLYTQIADQLKQELLRMIERHGIVEKDPLMLAAKMKLHPDWPKILKLAYGCKEITGIYFYYSHSTKDIVMIYPEFELGHDEKYFSVRREIYLNGKMESESIDFPPFSERVDGGHREYLAHVEVEQYSG